MSREYIHGFSKTEQDRLTQMQSILNARQLETFDFAGVLRVLDVGSGLGQMTRAIANCVADLDVMIGVEKSTDQLQEAIRQAANDGETTLVEFRQGDATDLPLDDGEWSSFDIVHARFLLEHVPEPLVVVRQMVAAAKSGGRIYLMDDDHELLRLSPDCPELDHAWRVYWESYRDLGYDPLIGRRQPQLLEQAGAMVESVESVFYGAVQGETLFDPVVDNLLGVISGATDQLFANGRLTPKQFDCALEAAQVWRQRPSATVWYSLPVAIGVRK